MKLEDINVVKLIESLMQDECYTLEKEDEKIDNNIIIVDYNMQNAPRETKDIFSKYLDRIKEPISLEIDKELEDDENYNKSYLVRTGVRLYGENNKNHNEKFKDINLEPDQIITIILTGYLSLGQYCDDDADGYLGGKIYITLDNEEEAIKASNESCLSNIRFSISNASTKLRNLINLSKELDPDGNNDIIKREIREIASAAFSS